MGRPSHVSSLRVDPQQSRGKRGEKISNYMETHTKSASLVNNTAHLQANEHRTLHHLKDCHGHFRPSLPQPHRRMPVTASALKHLQQLPCFPPPSERV